MAEAEEARSRHAFYTFKTRVFSASLAAIDLALQAASALFVVGVVAAVAALSVDAL